MRTTRFTRPLLLAALAPALLLAACGDDDTSTAATAPGGAAATVAPPATDDVGGGTVAPAGGGGELMATIELTIDGGPDSGDHTAEARGTGCTRNPFGAGTFGLQYSTEQATGFHSLQILVNDADAAASGGTDDFTATAALGSTRYHLGRTGSITVDDRGDTATISYEGTTDQGAEVAATITCHTVVGLG